jgi:UDP-N-acetylglucosamine 2-epimerase (non-hydrolysing)
MQAKLKVLVIFGTRPEAVKMAPVIQVLKANPQIETRVCVTAQHREMLDQVLNLFEITPDVDLNLMRPSQALSTLTSQILTQLDPVLEAEKPDWILVQGDTTTVMAASLAAFYRGIKVGHIEAGLRTGDKSQPFPEEINRRLTSVLADLHFAPTELSRDNLLKEGILGTQILVTGNTVIDALLQISNQPMPADVAGWLQQWGIAPGGKRLVVVTAHRRENFGSPIESICAALKSLADKFKQEIHIVYPVHLNPLIQAPVKQRLSGIPNLTLLDPLDYLPMIHLLKSASLVLTDSGGIQEEATGLGKPTLVLREKTERPEGVSAGVLKLVGTDTDKIINETSRLLTDQSAWAKMAHAANPFGDGHAANHIVQGILDYPSFKNQ